MVVAGSAAAAHLVWDLPRLEALEVLKQHRRKLARELGRHRLKRPGRRDALHDALEAGRQRQSRLKDGLLQLAHGLKDVRRSVGDHEAGQENAHIDVLRRQRKRRRAMAERRQHVDALEALLGHRYGALLAQEDDESLEAAERMGQKMPD
jgi:hypothetical protein